MLQFYFLSVLLNLVTGLLLVFAEKSGENNDDTNSASYLASNKNFRLVLGILALFVGFIKFIAVMPTDVPVIGDLLPSLAGLVGGFTILLDFYITSTNIEVNLNYTLETIFVKGRRYIGIFCLIAAVLHFLFPRVLFL